MSTGHHYDATMGVLYVRCSDARIVTSREAPNDGATILNYGEDGSVIGAQVIDADSLTTAEWAKHPDRALISPEVFGVVAEWIAARERKLDEFFGGANSSKISNGSPEVSS